MARFWKFLRDDSGTTAIEYAFICGIIGGLLIVTFTHMGVQISTKFIPVSNGLN